MKYLFFLLTFFYLISDQANAQDTITTDSLLNYYQKILKKDKNSSFGNYAMASAYFESKQYKSAIFYCDQNLKRTNEYEAATYLIKAISYDRLANPEEAKDIFEHALKKFPSDYKLWHYYAFSCYKMQAFEKAKNANEKARALSPYFQNIYNLQASLMFEGSNDKKLIHYLLFSLMLNKDGDKLPMLAFIQNYLERKYDNIQVPYFDKRYKLQDVESIYEYYSSKNQQEAFLTNSKDLPLVLIQFLSSQKIETPLLLKNFFHQLKEEKLEEAFVHYCLRFSKIEYSELWLKEHKEELERFVNFLEENLPE